MKIGVLKETRSGETRVAISPDSVKKLKRKGFEVLIQESAGILAGYSDDDFRAEGAEIVPQEQVYSSAVLFKINPPVAEEITSMKERTLLLCMLEPYKEDNNIINALANANVDAFSLELVPRTSRAQSMDVLSSQANIGGYRAVLEAAAQFGRFFPMMMTSAGSAKPAKCAVLGVAGLQAIATARRLGCQVEAYDIRPEVKEQILSLGAKCIELEIEEEGSGEGGYAKELSEEGKRKQQEQLNEALKKFDIIITTANIPGRKAPVLVTEDAVKGMRTGSVIIDMAAANGGNCPLSEPDQTVVKHDVKIVGITNFPALVPSDASNFYSKNLMNLLNLVVEGDQEEGLKLNYNFEDDIVDAALAVFEGKVRMKR